MQPLKADRIPVSELLNRLADVDVDDRFHPNNASVLNIFFAKFITDEILDTKVIYKAS